MSSPLEVAYFPRPSVNFSALRTQASQRVVLSAIGEKLQVTNLEDWYNVKSQKVIEQQGGSACATRFASRSPFLTALFALGATILRKYNKSLFSALTALFPEHEWLAWRFVSAPNNFWASRENRRKYFEWLGKELDIKQLEDWYSVTKPVIRKYGGSYGHKNQNLPCPATYALWVM
jgi:hypothetical protein